MANYYGPNFVPNPVFRELIDEGRRQGIGIMFYANFGMEPDLDHHIAPYAEELAYLPKRNVFSAIYTCGTSPAKDYYLWGWKKTIDYYGVQGMHMDSTLQCKYECKNLAHGCGWYDENGSVRGRWPFFGTREKAKRFHWLFHVYRPSLPDGKMGIVRLHAGAASFPFVSAFVDHRQHGEGGYFMSSKFLEDLPMPERFPTGTATFRYGVPIQILTKGRGMPYGPNYLYLYALLFNQDLRCRTVHLFPSAWYYNEKDPQRQRDKSLGEFKPYFAKMDVHSFPIPQALWWMLSEEFDRQHADFHPFWRNEQFISLNDDKLRCSLWLHPGQRAMFVVSNFKREAVDAEVKVNLETLGLAGRTLRAWDAYTDEDYPIQDGAIKLTIPGTQYRLVRIEEW